MNLADFIADTTRRATLARDTGTAAGYLWQIATGWRGKKASLDLAVRIETATGGVVTVEELRPDLPWVRVDGRPLLDPVAMAQCRRLAA